MKIVAGNTLQHTATHCNTLQHTATHCKHTANTLQHHSTRACATDGMKVVADKHVAAVDSGVLQCAAVCCSSVRVCPCPIDGQTLSDGVNIIAGNHVATIVSSLLQCAAVCYSSVCVCVSVNPLLARKSLMA